MYRYYLLTVTFSNKRAGVSHSLQEECASQQAAERKAKELKKTARPAWCKHYRATHSTKRVDVICVI